MFANTGTSIVTFNDDVEYEIAYPEYKETPFQLKIETASAYYQHSKKSNKISAIIG
ncbi:MAG: hypothetical protein R6U02_04340 [Alkalibacterium sp.]|uniref:hypothetical protein n=1 Tax=Alkalibacterium sp. TaxID=1872447 RepID=UPI003970CB1B